MRIKDNSDRHARHVAALIKKAKPENIDPLSGIWNWVNGVANGVDHFLHDTVLGGFKAIWQHLQNLDGSIGDILNALRRIVFWVDILIWHTVQSWIRREQARTTGELTKQRHYLVGLIFITTQTVLSACMHAVNTERRQRQRQVKYAEAKARAEIRAMHGVIEREAASGYRVNNDQRGSVIVKLLDFAASRNPVIRAVTRDIATGVLDLLSVEDPPLRILLGFLIRQVIDRLGIDKAVGALISDLIEPIIGKGPPKDLHDTIMDMSDRLLAMESQWSQFMQDGGSQVEQAGKDWRNITSLATGAAIVAFTIEAVVDPTAWARQISGTVGAAANDVALHAAKLFGGK
jgi:hypothetical protein